MNKQTKERVRQLKDIEDVMRTTQGRNVMNRILHMTNLYMTSYHPEAKEGAIYFKEGSRNVGLMLMSELQAASPELFNQMTMENIERLSSTHDNKGDDNDDE